MRAQVCICVSGRRYICTFGFRSCGLCLLFVLLALTGAAKECVFGLRSFLLGARKCFQCIFECV